MPRMSDLRANTSDKVPPTVFVIANESMARQVICALAESLGLKTLEFKFAEDFLENFNRNAVGCVVADAPFCGMSGMELLKCLGKTDCKLPIVIITTDATIPAVRAVRHGVVKVLNKPLDTHALGEAIQEGIRQDRLGRVKASELEDLRERFSRLTRQERMVLDLIVKGHINRNIARVLDISERTVESRRQQGFLKTGAKNLGELMWNAMMLKADGYEWFTEE